MRKSKTKKIGERTLIERQVKEKKGRIIKKIMRTKRREPGKMKELIKKKKRRNVLKRK